MIPYGKHCINQADIDAVTNTLKHAFLTQGSAVPAFEQALCNYTGAAHAVAVNSGTSALHLACLALDIGEGDIVWTVPNTFVASANCARYCGAQVDFVDISPTTRQICIEKLGKKLTLARNNNTLPKAIVVVHFAGHACDMKSIKRLADEFGFAVIEDAAHALGASDAGQYKIGNTVYSDMAILSFHPVKSITTAEGGALLTHCKELAMRARRLASHGITKQREEFLCPKATFSHYEQHELGFNYRLSDLHAALGVSQMKRLNDFVAARLSLAKRYHSALQNLPLILPQLDVHSAWHLYVVELTHHDRETVFSQLRDLDIGVNVHYIPVHWHPYYQQLGFTKGQFPDSEQYYKRAITLPLYPDLSADNQDKVIQALEEVLR